MPPQWIQIAGVHDLAEAESIIAAGATHLGMPLRLRDGREDLSEPAARALVAAVRGRIETVLITYQSAARDIADFVAYLGVSGVQLHGPVSVDELRALRGLLPDLFIIKSLVVRQDNADELQRLLADTSPWVDAYITDTYDPATGRTGATGMTHDWQVSRMLVQQSTKPIFLAGGLTAANVEQAVRAVLPAGVDAHTGVEGADGRKVASLVRAFVDGARAAWRHADIKQ